MSEPLDRSIPAVVARLKFGDSDGDDHDIAAAEIERLRTLLTDARAMVAFYGGGYLVEKGSGYADQLKVAADLVKLDKGLKSTGAKNV